MICDCGNGLPTRIQCVSCGRDHEIDDGLAAQALTAAESAELLRLRNDVQALAQVLTGTREALARSEEFRHQQTREDRERVEELVRDRDAWREEHENLLAMYQAEVSRSAELREHATARQTRNAELVEDRRAVESALSAARAEIARLTGAVRGLLVVIDACDRANVVPNARGEKAMAARAVLALPQGEEPPARSEEGGITEAEIAELERMEREDAWAAPWVARTFEIDCPCPNGEHCGNPHTCEEVEAREAYPSNHEEPAAEGEGQCVVQIDVPGLESLAGPNARFIAAIRNALPRVLAELRRLRAARPCPACGKENP